MLVLCIKELVYNTAMKKLMVELLETS